MELIKSINSNQIEKLNESGLPITKFEVLLQTDKSLTYFIDTEINAKKLHIIIGCNWESKDGGIHIYDDRENVITNYELVDINSIDDLNNEVLDCILNHLVKAL